VENAVRRVYRELFLHGSVDTLRAQYFSSSALRRRIADVLMYEFHRQVASQPAGHHQLRASPR